MTRTKPRTARGTRRGRGRRKDHHTVTDDSAEREYVRELFTDPEAPDPQPEPADPMAGNHVPREGANVGPGPLTGEAEVREWAAELFGRAALELP